MSWQSAVEILVLIAALAITAPPLGRYRAKVYMGGKAPGDRFFEPIERRIHKICRVDAKREQRWNVYALALLAFSMVSILVIYVLQRVQGSLLFNPTNRTAVTPWGAWNTAVSFVTNTNWQWYSGEQTMSHLTQMLGLTVQNFVSAAVGMLVAIAIICGLVRTRTRHLGNFWVDLVRTTVRILIPLSLVFTVVLMSQGVIQNFHGNTQATTFVRHCCGPSPTTCAHPSRPSRPWSPGCATPPCGGPRRRPPTRSRPSRTRPTG